MSMQCIVSSGRQNDDIIVLFFYGMFEVGQINMWAICPAIIRAMYDRLRKAQNPESIE
jgi:hypothetical protein